MIFKLVVLGILLWIVDVLIMLRKWFEELEEKQYNSRKDLEDRIWRRLPSNVFLSHSHDRHGKIVHPTQRSNNA